MRDTARCALLLVVAIALLPGAGAGVDFDGIPGPPSAGRSIAALRDGIRSALVGRDVVPTVSDVEALLSEIAVETESWEPEPRERLHRAVPAALGEILIPGDPLVAELLSTDLPDLQRIALTVIHRGDTTGWLEEPDVLAESRRILASESATDEIRLSVISAFASAGVIGEVLDEALDAAQDPERSGSAALWIADGLRDDVDGLLEMARMPQEDLRRAATMALVQEHARDLSDVDRSAVSAEMAAILHRDDEPPALRLGALRVASEVRGEPAIRDALLEMLEPARWFRVEYPGQPPVHSLPVVLDVLDWGNDPDVRARVAWVRDDVALLDEPTRSQVELRLSRILRP